MKASSDGCFFHGKNRAIIKRLIKVHKLLCEMCDDLTEHGWLMYSGTDDVKVAASLYRSLACLHILAFTCLLFYLLKRISVGRK